MPLQADLQAAVAQAAAASALLHAIVHGDDQTEVTTEGGAVKTVARAIAEARAAIDQGVGDLSAVVAAVEGVRVGIDQSAATAAGAAAAQAQASAAEAAASTQSAAADADLLDGVVHPKKTFFKQRILNIW